MKAEPDLATSPERMVVAVGRREKAATNWSVRHGPVKQ